MNQILFRIIRSTSFWFVLLLNLMVTVVYSFFYYANAEPINYRWNGYIESYNNTQELAQQLVAMNNYYDEVIANYSNEPTESNLYELALVEQTVVTMEYLLENNLSYSEIMDGDFISATSVDRRSYMDETLSIGFITQLISSVILICLIVNIGRSNGAFVFDLFMHGRKKLFIHELLCYTSLQALLFITQVLTVGIFGLFFPLNSEKLLFYNNGDIKVISVAGEFFGNVFSALVMLASIWFVLFLLSQIINRALSFVVVATAIVTAWLLLPVYIDIDLFNNLQLLWTSTYMSGYKIEIFGIISIVRIATILASLVAAYLYATKKRYSIRYE